MRLPCGRVTACRQEQLAAVLKGRERILRKFCERAGDEEAFVSAFGPALRRSEMSIEPLDADCLVRAAKEMKPTAASLDQWKFCL